MSIRISRRSVPQLACPLIPRWRCCLSLAVRTALVPFLLGWHRQHRRTSIRTLAFAFGKRWWSWQIRRFLWKQRLGWYIHSLLRDLPCCIWDVHKRYLAPWHNAKPFCRLLEPPITKPERKGSSLSVEHGIDGVHEADAIVTILVLYIAVKTR